LSAVAGSLLAAFPEEGGWDEMGPGESVSLLMIVTYLIYKFNTSVKSEE